MSLQNQYEVLSDKMGRADHHHFFRPRCFSPAMLFAFSEIMEVDQSGKKNPGQDSFGPFASGFFLAHFPLIHPITKDYDAASMPTVLQL